MNYYIGNIGNFYSGTSMLGAGIGSIATEINAVRQHDPQIADALEQLSKVNEIQQDVKELTKIIMEYYSQPETKLKNKIKISDILDNIKKCGEVATVLAPLYNILAQKFNLPLLPTQIK
ncbi:MAG: hypothetical protein GX213_13245 [Clostridiaceae bacterium]|nr:hypothetical protein [Clostridiaceae bacterium]